jgi:hypothetical protein
MALKKRPRTLKATALATLYQNTAGVLHKMEQTSEELVAVPDDQLRRLRDYLSNLPDANYSQFLNGVIAECKRLNGKGSYIELVVVPKRAKRFHYEGGMFDLTRTISIVTGCLPLMRRLEDFKFHINWLPHESIDFVQDSFVSAFQGWKYLKRVEIVGFDLPIGLLTSSLAANCHDTLEEFIFQDLDDGSQALGIGDGVYESMSQCEKLRVLDFKGIADSDGLYDQFLSNLDGQRSKLERLGVMLGVAGKGKLLRQFLKTDGGEPFGNVKALALSNVALHYSEKLSFKFPNLQEMSVMILALQTQGEQAKPRR